MDVDAVDADAPVEHLTRLEYDPEYTTDEGSDTSVEAVVAIRIDDEWYAWIEYGWLLGPDTSVETNRDVGSNAVEFTLTDRGHADGVYVEGQGIEDPTAYTVTEIGESVPVSWETDGRVEYTAIAYIGDPGAPTATRPVHEFGHESSL